MTDAAVVLVFSIAIAKINLETVTATSFHGSKFASAMIEVGVMGFLVV